MKITLYKECCLNNNYQLVLAQGLKNLLDANSSPFLLYLNSLNKVEIEIENSYMENAGTLIFDFSTLGKYTDIYNFNYMKVEFTFSDDLTKIERYCFIDDIEIKNELVYLKYSEDYWHSYSSKIKGINPSWLVSSRLITEYDNNNSFRLPYGILKLGYDSFEGINIQPMPGINLLEDRFTIIIEIQSYDAVSTTKTSDRDFNYLIYKDENGNDLLYGDFNKLKDFIKGMTNKYKLRFNVGTPGNPDYKYYYYEVGSIYVFPNNFHLSNAGDFNSWIVKPHGTGESSDDDVIKGYFYEFNIEEIRTMATIDASFMGSKYLGVNIGTINTRLEYNYNKINTNFNAKIKFMGNKYGISVMLDFQGQLADITKDFELNYPVEYMGAAEFKQQKISSVITQGNAVMNIMTNLFGMNASWANALNTNIKSITSFGGSSMNYAQNAENSGATGEAGMYMAMAKMIGQVNANDMNYVAETAKYTENIFRDAGILLKLNSAAYGTNKGILKNNSSNIINILNGIMVFAKIPYNRFVVKQVINNYGYSTEMLIHNDNFSNLHLQDAKFFQDKQVPINYNFIQFYDCSVYGDFTNKIAKILNRILNRGIKIYYNETLSEDNLDVG